MIDMKTPTEFMRLAIEEAQKSSEPLKCGVVVVKDGQVIAQTHNSQHSDHNATAHAEIKAFGIAGQAVGDKNLRGCEIYCTCEPCIMCASAISFAKVDKLYFGTTLNDVSPVNKRIDITLNDFLKKAPHQFEVIANFLEDECKELIN